MALRILWGLTSALDHLLALPAQMECVRREMQGWRLLQLEPAALRQPDEFSAPTHLESNGRHLPANQNRLATGDQAVQVNSQLANRLSELTLSLVGRRSMRIFSLLASRLAPKSLAATCAII